MGIGQQFVEVVPRRIVEGIARGPRELGVRFSSFPFSFALVSRTRDFVGARTQSSRRKTVNGRMTSWYLPRLTEEG
jgi:hypothetical protein